MSLILWIVVMLGFMPFGDDDEESFAKSLLEVRELIDGKRWKDAKSTLNQLVLEHGQRSYTMSRRTEILEEWRRVCVRLAVPEPRSSDLISGDLVFDNFQTGKLKVLYGTSQYQDFYQPEESLNGIYYHPVSFVGDYAIRVEGDRAEELTLYVCVHEGRAYAIDVRKSTGSSKPEPAGSVIVVSRIDGANAETLESKPSSVTMGNAFNIQVKVTKSSIAVYLNNHRLLRVDNESRLFGGVALNKLHEIESVTIEGKAHSSWLRGLRDSSVRDAEDRFLKEEYRPERELPGWLFETALSADLNLKDTEASSNELSRLPWKYDRRQQKNIETITSLLNEKRYEEVIDVVLHSSASKLPASFAEYFLAIAYSSSGRTSEALKSVNDMLARTPHFAQAQWMRSNLNMRVGAFEEARGDLEDLVSKFPSEAQFWRAYIETLLWKGDLKGARKAILKARCNDIDSKVLDDIDTMTVKAERGPNWTRSYSEESPHYVVFSDIDQKSAKEVSSILEKSFAFYVELLGEAPGKTPLFRAYVFAGQAGFESYSSHLFGKTQENAAGLYSPALKQLLIWNVSDRGEVLRVARHEGLHQYLDLIGARVPVWFNEGLAGCVEYVDTGYGGDFGRIKRTEIHEGHARFLRENSTDLPPLEDLISLNQESFYESARLNYAHSWAFVRFLREKKHTDLFSKIMQISTSGHSPADVVNQAFKGVDLSRLNVEFLKWMQKEIKGK